MLGEGAALHTGLFWQELLQARQQLPNNTERVIHASTGEGEHALE